MNTLFFILFYYLLNVIKIVQADVYMHNPRGSNDRNCERNVNRNNGNRLFDSQNNNNGGYACERGVGDEIFQAEDGTAQYSIATTNNDGTDDLTTYTQNKRKYYYSGSILPIEWTNQHGCGGNSKVLCEIVLQYACEDTLDPRVDNFWPWVASKGDPATEFYGKQHFRSGSNIGAPRDGVPRDVNDAATDTIPDVPSSAIANTIETRRFGMHESNDFYQVCQRTSRNRGLYAADQVIHRNDQRGTRQNPNGNRNGLECPEERDYYPWWHPSPWIDIAVLSDSALNNTLCSVAEPDKCSTRCRYYVKNTMNFNKKGYCDVNHTNPDAIVSDKLNHPFWQQNKWYNNKAECESQKVTTKQFKWYEVSHSDNLNLATNSFVCAHTQFARTNQLGNALSDTVISQSQNEFKGAVHGIVKNSVTEGLNANRFLWTIPDIPTAKSASYFGSMESAYKSCTLRIRYNVSTGDLQQWPIEAVDNGTDKGTNRMVDWRDNANRNTGKKAPFQQDQYVYIGPGDYNGIDKTTNVIKTRGDQFVRLKLNTNQWGRTFQDRSYVFSIKPLPTTSVSDSFSTNYEDIPPIDVTSLNNAIKNGGKIYNVNVRGKRGNIVQTFPSVEYDFVPNALALNQNDIIHFQWTGSDYNPRRGCNDATGGPPDLNTYSTAANANINPRADRSNIIFTNHMGNNAPKDYLGNMSSTYTTPTIPGIDPEYELKYYASMNAVLDDNNYVTGVPCYSSGDTIDEKKSCYEAIRRLAYLNQQSDKLSLTLRTNAACLTESQLKDLGNDDTANFHPLNCAKMNARPHPYFDGGLMLMKNSGWFPFFSSRNNNFSNRQQIGVICVKKSDGSGCEVNSDQILQDKNPMVNGVEVDSLFTHAPTASSTNAPTASVVQVKIYSLESFSIQDGDNDLKGDGNLKSCEALSSMGISSNSGSNSSSSNSDELAIGLAISLFFIGLFCSWLAYYLYNRYQARKEAESKFRYDTSWQHADAPDKLNRADTFAGVNPVAVPISMKSNRSTSSGFSDNSSSRSNSPLKNPSSRSTSSTRPPSKRYEMI